MAVVTITRKDGATPERSDLDLEVIVLGTQLIVQGGSDFERFWQSLLRGPGGVVRARFDLTLGKNTFRQCAVQTVGSMAIRNEGHVRQLVIVALGVLNKHEERWRLAGRASSALGFGLLILAFALIRPMPKSRELFQGFGIASVFLMGVPLAQAVVARAIGVCAKLFGPDVTGGDENRWPQRLVGVLESACYPIAFTLFASDASNVVGAWIGLKTFGDWSRFKGNDVDPDAGRRRLYRFMIGNAVQVASGLGVAWAVKRFL